MLRALRFDLLALLAFDVVGFVDVLHYLQNVNQPFLQFGHLFQPKPVLFFDLHPCFDFFFMLGSRIVYLIFEYLLSSFNFCFYPTLSFACSQHLFSDLSFNSLGVTLARCLCKMVCWLCLRAVRLRFRIVHRW